MSKLRIYSEALDTAVKRLWMLLGIPNYRAFYIIPSFIVARIKPATLDGESISEF